MVSASIVELTETKEIPQFDTVLLSSFNCSSSGKADGLGLGPESFTGLFLICGCIALLVLLYIGLQFMKLKLGWIQKSNEAQQAMPHPPSEFKMEINPIFRNSDIWLQIPPFCWELRKEDCNMREARRLTSFKYTK